MTGWAASWSLAHRHAPADELHALDLPDPVRREVWVLVPDRPALVLGSTQDGAVVDAGLLAGRGIDLVRRCSGGGAVLLDAAGALGAGPTLWVDLVVPREDPLWVDDVGRSSDWLGDTWTHALASLGVEASVHCGRLERTVASTLVCFAGLGPGEVLVNDRKVVGISQRRTRRGARFQCIVHLAPPGPSAVSGEEAGVAAIVDVLAEPVGGVARAELAAHLRRTTGAVRVDAGALLAALLAALPTAG